MNLAGIRSVVVGLGLLVASPTAFAQSEPRELSERQAVSLALEHGAESRALLAEAEVARAAIGIAELRDPTTLSYSLYGRTSGDSTAINGTQHQVWMEQSVLGGRRRVRRDSATMASRAADRGADAALFEIELETRRRYAELAAASARTDVVRSARDELARIVEIVEGRAASGAHSHFDLVRARLELTRLDARLARLAIEVRSAAVRLAAQIGTGDGEPRASDALEAIANATRDAGEIRAAFDQHPELVAARERVEAARALVELARRESRPPPSVALGGYFTSDGRSSSLYGAVAVPIAAGARATAFTQHARAIVAAEEARLALVERALRSRLDTAIALREESRTLADSLGTSVGNSLSEIRNMVIAAYETGSAAAFELLGTYAATVDVELERVEALETLRMAEIDLAAVAGLRLDARP